MTAGSLRAYLINGWPGKLWHLTAPHALFLTYASIFLLIAVSYALMPLEDSMKKIGILLCYGTALVGAYVLIQYVLQRLHVPLDALTRYSLPLPPPAVITALCALALGFPLLYFIDLGYIPIVRYWLTENYYIASGMRHAIYQNLSLTSIYASEYYMRGFMPVWLVFCYLHEKPRLVYAMLAMAAFFTINSLTKTTIVIMFLPLLILQLARFDLRKGALTLALIFFGMWAVTSSSKSYITSAANVLEHEEMDAEQKAILEKNYELVTAERDSFDSKIHYELYKYIEALFLRVTYSQARVLEAWLGHIPDKHPYLEGCGYRWYAKIKGCEYINMPSLLWEKYYASYSNRGSKGNMSAADYINAYANFGITGVVVSAIVLTVVLTGLAFLYVNPLHLFAFNLTFVLLVLEAQLSTLINSGGWFVGVLTYILVIQPYAARSCLARSR